MNFACPLVLAIHGIFKFDLTKLRYGKYMYNCRVQLQFSQSQTYQLIFLSHYIINTTNNNSQTPTFYFTK